MFISFVRRGSCFVLMLVACIGCGDSSGMVPVTGTVKLDGQPLVNATVQFIPEEPGGQTASGTTDADGVFNLSTLKPDDGVKPGKYKVVIQPPARSGTPARSIDEAQKNLLLKKKAPEGIAFPARYSRPDQTILVQDVPSSSPVVFDLQSK